MRKSIEKLAEEQDINVYVALKFYDLGRAEEHDKNVRLTEAVRLLAGKETVAFRNGRHCQHRQDVEWLGDTLSPRCEIPFNKGHYWDRTIRDKDCEHFKEMKLE